MKFKEIFLGTEEENEATQRRSELEKAERSGDLRVGQKRELENAQELSRRKFMRQAGLAGLLVVAGGATALLSSNEEEADKPVKVVSVTPAGSQENPAANPPEQVEGFTDQVIARAEEGMARLESEIMPRIREIDNEIIKRRMMHAFQIVSINKANPNKNGDRLTRIMNLRGKLGGTINNPNYFFYSTKKPKGEEMGGASYHVVNRTMILPADFDPKNYWDLLVLFHETQHVLQDNDIRFGIRKKEDEQKYMALYDNRIAGPKSHINHEVSAYAFEIELMDIILNGKLREGIKEGKKWTARDLQIALNMRGDQYGSAKMLLHLAKLYFSGISENYEVPIEFIDTIAFAMEKAGRPPYTLTPDLNEIPYKPSKMKTVYEE